MRGKSHHEKVLGLALACLGAGGCSHAGLSTEKRNSPRVVPADEVAFRRPFPVAPEMAGLWGDRSQGASGIDIRPRKKAGVLAEGTEVHEWPLSIGAERLASQ